MSRKQTSFRTDKMTVFSWVRACRGSTTSSPLATRLPPPPDASWLFPEYTSYRTAIVPPVSFFPDSKMRVPPSRTPH